MSPWRKLWLYLTTSVLCLSQWMQLRNRKQNLVRLFEKMQQFQFMQVEDAPLPSGFRALTEEDIERYVCVCGGGVALIIINIQNSTSKNLFFVHVILGL